MTNEDMKHRRLQALSKSDFEVVEGQPDIRGWDVKDNQGRKIGEVEDLIVDAQRKKVRYMVVELEDNELDLDDDREVLLPIGTAQLHKDDDDVIVPNITVEQLSALPDYDEEGLDENVERAVCAAMGRSTTGYDDNFYQHEHFDDSKLYQRRLPASTTATAAQGESSGFGLRQRSGNSFDNTSAGMGNSLDREGNPTYTRQGVEEDALMVNRDNREDSPSLRSETDETTDELKDRERRNREGGAVDRGLL